MTAASSVPRQLRRHMACCRPSPRELERRTPSVLTERAKEILVAMHQHGFLTSELIELAFFPRPRQRRRVSSCSRALERIRCLWLWGCLNRVELPVSRQLGGRRPFRYTLGRPGVQIVPSRPPEVPWAIASQPSRRFLFITATPLDVAQGSGTFVGIAVLRRALVARGHRVHVVAPPAGWAAHLPFTLRRLLFNLVVRDAAARARPRPDICIGFDMDGVALRHLDGVPVVQSIKGVIADELTFERGAVRASLWLQSRAERVAVHRADLVMTTSRFAAARIAHHYRDRRPIAVVPEAIDLAAWQRAHAAVVPEARARPSVLCVAHLYPRKDVRRLVEAAAILARRGRAVDVRIVGQGPCRPALRAQVDRLGLADRVALLGHVPFAALAREYRGAGAFCLPSRQEGFGIVYLEAMAAGLPIVACRGSAVPEVVTDGECGLLVPPGDAPALADALERVLFDPALASALGRAGRARVRDYDAPRLAERFLAALDRF